MNLDRLPVFKIHIATLTICACVATSWAQTDKNQSSQNVPTVSGVTSLERHLDELTNQLNGMRQQLQDSQREMDELRNELRSLREQLTEKSEDEKAAQDGAALRASVEKLREDTDVLQAEVKQHDQIKVETASKYPVRISGTILFTSVLNG